MKKNSIIIIILVLAVVAGAVYFFLKPDDAGKEYYYSTGDPFVTNVVNSQMLVKTGVELTLSKDMGEKLATKKGVIRDAILYVLRTQTEEQYVQGDLRPFSDAIVARLNELFPQEAGSAPLFVKANFTDFVTQKQ